MAFEPVNPRVNFSSQEKEILVFWEKEKIFEKSLELRKKAERFVFFEGPPTANGMPGIHHVLARAFKDVWPRFKTMQGYLVERKAGWDTHGLPVEIEVEKKLGLKDKGDIEKYGVAKFNEQAKESVWKYLHEWEEMTKRMAFWVDLENPYITYEPKYVESLWWIIKQIWDKGLLYQGHKVVPYCPRCGTSLSSHEVAQGYQEVEERSVYIKLKVKGEDNTYILAWTTTPWTLPGNVALAVGKDIRYGKYQITDGPHAGETYILADALASNIFQGTDIVPLGYKLEGGVIPKSAYTHSPILDSDLVGLEYEPLFEGAIPKDTANYENAFKVYPADFVTTDDGTGVVHTAVMYGEDDYQLGAQVNLPRYHTVDKQGRFVDSVKPFAGKYVKDPEVEKAIVSDLEKRGLLLKEMDYSHDYPFCWRCDSPLLYYAMDSWFINMQQVKTQLIANNQDINWVPAHLKDGRFGEWLNEIKDWAFSRERYWGTPLPVWKEVNPPAGGGDMICVGSFEELRELAKDKTKVTDSFDPHKPFVDEIVLEKDGKEYRRVPEVCDVWFDSGCMPFAQWHYPFENQEKIDKGLSFPAEFISEAVDQTRGWFYTLLAVSTLLDKGAPYKNVVSLGHVLDKYGKKMSKSKGNVVDPNKIFESQGSDALRWYLYTINQPGLPKNFDEGGVTQVVRRFMLTLWNTYSFFVTYANIDKFDPNKAGELAPKSMLDKWIWARRHQLVEKVTEHLEKYEPMQAGLAIEDFVEDLSNWYVRRSRRRFWKGENDADKVQAYLTLYMTLKDLTKLMAPFMPFLSEAIYRNLRTAADPMSVHVTNWPQAEMADETILQQMSRTREMVEAILNLREQAGIKVRQPLAKFAVVDKELPSELVDIIREEANIKELLWEQPATELDTKITDDLALEGLARELVRSIQVLRKENGFEIEDRIKITWSSDADMVKKAFDVYSDYIKGETLADEIKAGAAETAVKVNEFKVNISLTKSS
ncbi:MAG: isoleucine--tRNA ligase [Patescibacteria group bacterium]|nr:isoleucine--tRNA ligase [Patescibacteria group bacterium]